MHKMRARKQPQGRSAPLWGAAEDRAFAFFVKYDDSVPAYMDSVYNYIHFASIWYDFPDYEDNSLFIPARAISDSREIYHFRYVQSLKYLKYSSRGRGRPSSPR